MEYEIEVRRLVVVHPYGSYDPELRTPREMQGLDEYLCQAVDLITKHRPSIAAVLATGGMVDTKGTVEANSLAAELKRRLKERGVFVEIINDAERLPVEKIPKSTIGIVGRAAEVADEVWRQYPRMRTEMQIWHVCDRVRRAKTWLLCRLDYYRTFKVFGFKRRDIAWQSTYPAQWLEMLLILFSRERVRHGIEAARS